MVVGHYLFLLMVEVGDDIEVFLDITTLNLHLMIGVAAFWEEVVVEVALLLV